MTSGCGVAGSQAVRGLDILTEARLTIITTEGTDLEPPAAEIAAA
jgi:hypothetical protein